MFKKATYKIEGAREYKKCGRLSSCKPDLWERCDHRHDLSRLLVQQALPMGPGACSSTVLWYFLVYKGPCAPQIQRSLPNCRPPKLWFLAYSCTSTQ